MSNTSYISWSQWLYLLSVSNMAACWLYKLKSSLQVHLLPSVYFLLKSYDRQSVSLFVSSDFAQLVHYHPPVHLVSTFLLSQALFLHPVMYVHHLRIKPLAPVTLDVYTAFHIPVGNHKLHSVVLCMTQRHLGWSEPHHALHLTEKRRSTD